MRVVPKLLVLMILGSLTAGAHAQIFSCRDGSGRSISSDRPIPECAARPMRELGSNGVVRREIPAPLTAEQRRQKQIEEERRKAEADAALEIRRRDLALLERFHNEVEIEAARKRAQNDVRERIRVDAVALAFAEKQLQEALADATRHKTSAGIPAYQARKIAESQESVSSSTDTLRQRQVELLKVDDTFDEALKRFRELTSSSASR